MANYYAIQDLNQSDRKRSTSGGFVTLLSNKLFQCGYIVYGAAFDENMLLKHTQATTSVKLERNSGSKYVQSKLSDTFKNIKKNLINDERVLFVGTPCQVAGLSAYLNNSSVDCANLVRVELKCYGVSSPGLFRKYIDFIEKKYKSKILDVRFRDKEYGYNTTVVKIIFDDRKELINNYYAKSFSKTFFFGNNVRPSCYNCGFRDYLNSNADFIVGDFHNISKYDKEMDDDIGTSFVAVLSEKGNRYLNLIKSSAKICLLSDYKEDIPRNPNIPPHREDFFQDSIYMSWGDLIRKYCPKSLFDDMAYYLKPLIARSSLNKHIFSLINKINNYKYKLKTRN